MEVIYSEKALFFKNYLLFSGARFRQSKYMVLMTKEESTKIVNFMTPVGTILVLRRGHKSHKVKTQVDFHGISK